MLVENFNYLTAHNPVMTRDTYLPRSLSLSLSLSPSLIIFLLLNPNKHPCRALARKLACRSAVLSQARDSFRIRNGEQRYRVKPRARARAVAERGRFSASLSDGPLLCRSHVSARISDSPRKPQRLLVGDLSPPRACLLCQHGGLVPLPSPAAFVSLSIDFLFLSFPISPRASSRFVGCECNKLPAHPRISSANLFMGDARGGMARALCTEDGLTHNAVYSYVARSGKRRTYS